MSAVGLIRALVVAANVGVPVSQMDDTYVRESATLSEAIIKYGTLDLYDPQRVQVINVSPHSTRHAGHCLHVATHGMQAFELMSAAAGKSSASALLLDDDYCHMLLDTCFIQ